MTDYFYAKICALGRSVSFFFCHANTKLTPKHWTIIFIENITNSRSQPAIWILPLPGSENELIPAECSTLHP